MADGVEVRLTGLAELQRSMKTATKEMRDTAANAGARKAARHVAMEAYKGAQRIDDPESRADISQNIWQGGTKFPGVKKVGKRFTGSDAVKYRVGVAGGAGGNRKKNDPHFNALPGGDTRHWRFWEFGSENTQARPFLRPALQQNRGAVMSAFVTEFKKGLQRAERKRAKAAAGRSRSQNFRRSLFGVD